MNIRHHQQYEAANEAEEPNCRPIIATGQVWQMADEVTCHIGEVGKRLTEVFSNEEEDPSTKAARKLDWESFMGSLNDRCQAIPHVLAKGGQLKELAKTLKVSTSTINTGRMTADEFAAYRTQAAGP